LGLLFVPAVLSMFWALDWTYGAFELFRMFEMFLFFLVAVNYLRTDRQLKIVIVILGADIIFQSVLAIMQFIDPWRMYDVLAQFGIYMGISHATPYDPASPIRACGTTGYCNFASLYFFYPLSRAWKRTIIALLALSLVALLLTYSRGGLLAMAVAAVALIILGIRRFPELAKHVLRVTFAVGIQIAIIFALLSEQLFMRLRFFMETMEDEVRVALMINAIEMIKDNPLLGVGLNNFPEAFYTYEVTGLDFEMLFPVHNTWLLIASEQGLIGLAAFLIFMLYIFLDARRSIKDVSRLHAATAVGLTAGLLGWFTHNMVAPLYQNWLINRTTFIFVVAILAILWRLRSSGNNDAA
jgi:putative inorganic carbon (HCO3(-)) transporter